MLKNREKSPFFAVRAFFVFSPLTGHIAANITNFIGVADRPAAVEKSAGGVSRPDCAPKTLKIGD
ncbi:MAG: hypothetical protein KKE86_03170 [Planctomycetes bacterium]|nr:hypothetical protein [Planctomycetota bacterium]MBU4398318.1 hypothetical protein [Planctomycetota bacterium]MCG2682974.1 hypothetical protein [Planctomycetales bacterium]